MNENKTWCLFNPTHFVDTFIMNRNETLITIQTTNTNLSIFLSLHLFCKSHSAFNTTKEDLLRSKSYWRRKFLDAKAETNTTISILDSWILIFFCPFVLLEAFLDIVSLLRLSYQWMYRTLLLMFFTLRKLSLQRFCWHFFYY